MPRFVLRRGDGEEWFCRVVWAPMGFMVEWASCPEYAKAARNFQEAAFNCRWVYAETGHVLRIEKLEEDHASE